MLYTIAHFFRDKMGWLWNMIESINSQLFSIRYGKKLDELSLVEKPEGFEENKKVAVRGGKVANSARENYEKETGQKAISSLNAKDKTALEIGNNREEK